MGDMADMVNDLSFYTEEALISEEDEWQEEDYEESWRWLSWTTQDGQILRIREMETRHLFNAMKMCFNHLAEAHGGEPVWFTKVWSGCRVIAKGRPYWLARYVVAMLRELDRRTDLPSPYQYPLQKIREQVFGGPRRLEAPKLPAAPF